MQVDVSHIRVDTPRLSQAPLRAWMLGQILDASVIGRESKNSIRLQVAGAEVRAATNLPLAVGAKLKLEVTQLKPMITLRPVVSTPPPEQAKIRAALSESLPKQRPLAPTLDTLATTVAVQKSPTRVAHTPTQATPPAVSPERMLPTTLRHAIEQVLETIPTVKQLSDPKELLSAIKRSGVFAEQLTHIPTASKAETPKPDMKWQLLELRAVIDKFIHSSDAVPARKAEVANTKTPVGSEHNQRLDLSKFADKKIPLPNTEPDLDLDLDLDVVRKLSRLVDSAIAKIETHQFRGSSAILDGDYHLGIDVPVKLDDRHAVVQLKILRDPDDGESPAQYGATTTVVLELPVADDAVLRATLRHRPDELAVDLWSEHPVLRAELATHRDELSERLRANGFSEVRISIVEIQSIEAFGTRPDKLVDERA